MADNTDGIGQPIRRAYEHSQFRRVISTLRRVAADPEPVAIRQRRVAVGRTVRHARQHALTTRIARRCARAVRNARLYDWLTREPETSIVVVDLTETRTVGPIIAVVDRLGERFGWVGSRAAGVGDPVRRVVSERPVGVLAAVVTALLALVWWVLWQTGSPPVVLVAVAMLAFAALLCSRVTVSAVALATPLSYRLLMGILLPPDGSPIGEMSDDSSAGGPSTRESTGAEDDSDQA